LSLTVGTITTKRISIRDIIDHRSLEAVMPHHITNCVFARTSLTTCDVFVMALAHLDPRTTPSPEEFIAATSPWFLDAETVWWRKFLNGTG
jgi:hypothetical protein